MAFDLEKLFVDVFAPLDGDVVTVVYDLPHGEIRDHDEWRERREMAESWQRQIAAFVQQSGPREESGEGERQGQAEEETHRQREDAEGEAGEIVDVEQGLVDPGAVLDPEREARGRGEHRKPGRDSPTGASRLPVARVRR